MPTNFIQNVADVCNISVATTEELWDNAKVITLESGKKENTPAFYAYVTGVFKKSLGNVCTTKLAAKVDMGPTSEEELWPQPTFSDSPSGRVLRMFHEARTRKPRYVSKTAKPMAKDEKPVSNTAKPVGQVPKPVPNKPKPVPKNTVDGKLANDLAELYQEMMHRWSKLSDATDDDVVEPVEWSKDNPYAKLPATVRETLQAGAALHYDELSDVRQVAERAMREWNITQPQLATELAKIQELPKMHRKALEPIVSELVKRGLLPPMVKTYLETDVTVGTLDWLNAFPSLLAANANNATNISNTAETVVLENLLECLLHNTG